MIKICLPLPPEQVGHLARASAIIILKLKRLIIIEVWYAQASLALSWSARGIFAQSRRLHLVIDMHGREGAI